MTAAPVAARDRVAASDLREHLRDAAARKRRLRIVAGGSWLDANRPVRADETLDVSANAGIVEYEPGDLTLTARAGTTLGEIARVTAANGQWLALDPYGDPSRATIGATIATASYGPLAHHFGTPRDMTLGVEFITGGGDIVRGGGRVVKNVAGFDLTRLVTGSWGTLGLLTETTLRLRARPAMQTTLIIDVGGGDAAVERARATLHGMPFVPLAAQLLDASAARALSARERDTGLLVRLGGNDEALRAQRERMRAVGDAEEVDQEIWARLQRLEPPLAAVLRLSRLPSAFASTWRDAMHIAERWPGGYCHGDPGRGVVRVVLPHDGESSEASLHSVLDVPFDGARIYERLPANLWPALATAILGRIDRGIKAAFDPGNMLNPGILGELQ